MPQKELTGRDIMSMSEEDMRTNRPDLYAKIYSKENRALLKSLNHFFNHSLGKYKTQLEALQEFKKLFEKEYDIESEIESLWKKTFGKLPWNELKTLSDDEEKLQIKTSELLYEYGTRINSIWSSKNGNLQLKQVAEETSHYPPEKKKLIENAFHTEFIDGWESVFHEDEDYQYFLNCCLKDRKIEANRVIEVRGRVQTRFIELFKIIFTKLYSPKSKIRFRSERNHLLLILRQFSFFEGKNDQQFYNAISK